MKLRKMFQWLLIPFCIILISSFGALATIRTSLANRNTPTPVFFQQDILDNIRSINTVLTQAPTYSKLYVPKVTQLVAEATFLAENAGTPIVMKPETIVPQTDSPIATGLFEGGDGVFKPGQDVIENTWAGIITGQIVEVYAGAKVNDPGQGIIYVSVMSKNRTRGTWSHYLTPVKSGAARIQSFVCSRLVITTKGGDTLYFEAAAQRFVSSLTEMVPTLTPLPNDYPTLPAPITPFPSATPYP